MPSRQTRAICGRDGVQFSAAKKREEEEKRTKKERKCVNFHFVIKREFTLVRSPRILISGQFCFIIAHLKMTRNSFFIKIMAFLTQINLNWEKLYNPLKNRFCENKTNLRKNMVLVENKINKWCPCIRSYLTCWRSYDCSCQFDL